MTKPNRRRLAKELAKDVEWDNKARRVSRKDLWKGIHTQEEFDQAVPRLRKKYGKKAFVKAVKARGFSWTVT